jgi:hypothetical protein
MNPFQKCTVIKPLLFLALMWAGAFAYAGPPVGAVTHLSGPLLATKTDGSSRVLATNSMVEQGDTLTTQRNGYAQIKFSDDSLLVLQPDTILTIDRFSYDADKPTADDIALTLVQGGVRSTAGLVGKRSKDRVTLTTPGGIVNLQGASAIIQYRKQSAEAKTAALAFLMASTAGLDSWQMTSRSDAPLPLIAAVNLITPTSPSKPLSLPLPPTPSPTQAPNATLSPGLYVQVIDGLINVTNHGGTQNFAAGQFGFTPNPIQPPVIMPKDPGLQFKPPSAFSALPAGPSPSKPNVVNCEVR